MTRLAHPPRVAIVHDWLVGGGAESVVLALHQMYPEAPIYTSYCNDEWRKKLDGKVVTGWLQGWPWSRLRKFLPVLRIWWFTHLDLSDYDLVISSSGNGEAFGVKTSKNTVHVNYCHTPTHFYWRHYDTYMKNPGFGLFNPLARLGLRLLVGPLRRWDLKASKRPDYFIANSTHIKQDIKKYYGRDAAVIHPPVDVTRFMNQSTNAKRQGLLIAGRQVPYKRFDLAIQACTKLGLPLTVLGKGPEHSKLQAMAGPTVRVIEGISGDALAKQLTQAQAFIFPTEDDFGIMPVEAMAAGTPVIAFRGGGALDYVVEGQTGVFFDKQTVSDLSKALQSFDPDRFKASVLQHKAAEFSPEVFKKKMQTFIGQVLQRSP